MNSIIVIILFLISISILIYIKLRKKYKCTTSGCIEDINGNFKSLKKCINKCNISNENTIDKWSCTNNFECVKAEKGWNDLQSCNANCQKPQILSYPYYQSSYYPQSLLYRRPIYWDYNRRRHHRRHHSGRHHRI